MSGTESEQAPRSMYYEALVKRQIRCLVGTILVTIGWRSPFVRMIRSILRRFLPQMGGVFWASLSLWIRGILWANLSLWMRVVLTTRRGLSLRRTRRTRHLGTWCWGHTPLGFRARRVVLRPVLGEHSRVAGSSWSCAIFRNPVRCSGVAGRHDAAPAEFRRLRSGSD